MSNPTASLVYYQDWTKLVAVLFVAWFVFRLAYNDLPTETGFIGALVWVLFRLGQVLLTVFSLLMLIELIWRRPVLTATQKGVTVRWFLRSRGPIAWEEITGFHVDVEPGFGLRISRNIRIGLASVDATFKKHGFLAYRKWFRKKGGLSFSDLVFEHSAEHIVGELNLMLANQKSSASSG